MLLLFVSMVGAGCGSSGSPDPTKYIAVGAGASADGFAASGGNLLAQGGKPGVMFGTVTPPKGTTRLSYVILFKLPPAKSGFNIQSANDAKGLSAGGADIEAAHTIHGNRIEARSVFELKADRSAIEKETLSVGGQAADPMAGRLFLIDFTAASATYEQKDITLPDAAPTLTSEADVERFAESLIKSLREKNPEIARWLK